MAHQSILEFSTSSRGTRDITRDVAAVVAASQLQCGLVHVFVQHTSCSLLLTENADPDVRRDLETIAAHLAPDGDPAYRHDTEGPDDMAAHARSALQRRMGGSGHAPQKSSVLVLCGLGDHQNINKNCL